MPKVCLNCLTRLFISFLLVLGSISAYSQVPSTTTSSTPIDPNHPTGNLTNPQLQTYLRDQNAEPGKDLNADANRINKRDTIYVEKDRDRRDFEDPKNTYGANTFFGAPATSTAELSTPPADYPIGVGDHVIVSMYGGAEFQGNFIVGSDGSIFPAGIGKIFVGGLTFENVQRLLYSRFAAVVPPGTNIDISLGQPRTININVVNEVNKPGIITVSAFSNAFNVIAKAGGVTENGNLRNILIKRNGRVIEELDVYKYLQTGDFGKHIYLQNNDFIIVPFYEKKVLATGQFKRPMYYQLRRDEGIKALLKFSGGSIQMLLALHSRLSAMKTRTKLFAM